VAVGAGAALDSLSSAGVGTGSGDGSEGIVGAAVGGSEGSAAREGAGAGAAAGIGGGNAGGGATAGGAAGTAGGTGGGVGAAGGGAAGVVGGREGIGTNSPGLQVWGMRRIDGSFRKRSAWPHDRHTRVPSASCPRDRIERVPPPSEPVLRSFTQTKSPAPQLVHTGATGNTYPPSADGPSVKTIASVGPRSVFRGVGIMSM
jgi:hypothetical protein